MNYFWALKKVNLYHFLNKVDNKNQYKRIQCKKRKNLEKSLEPFSSEGRNVSLSRYTFKLTFYMIKIFENYNHYIFNFIVMMTINKWFFVYLFTSNSYGKQFRKWNEQWIDISRSKMGEGSQAGYTLETRRVERGYPCLRPPHFWPRNRQFTRIFHFINRLT